MSTMTNPSDARAAPDHPEASDRLRSDMAAMRLSFTWFGTRKTLTSEQKARAAQSFGAEGQFLSAGKKLIDTRHPAFKAVSSLRNGTAAFWRGVSLPFPDPGIRLIRRDDIDNIDRQMREFQSALADAVARLDEQFDQLKAAARDRLGSLYNPTDYPTTLRGAFEIAWDYPSVEPPPYLRRLSPRLYEAECRRVAARFDEAIQLAEQAFTEELAKLVDHLGERLSGKVDGKPKVFRDSAVANLRSFFDRFSHLNVRSNEQLDRIVNQARQIIDGIDPQDLRDSDRMRKHVASQLGKVQSGLDDLLTDKPRRNIIRPGTPAPGNPGSSSAASIEAGTTPQLPHSSKGGA